MVETYKLLLQTEEDIHKNTAGQKKVELNMKKLQEGEKYAAGTSEEEILREEMHSLLDGLLDEYLFNDKEGE